MGFGFGGGTGSFGDFDDTIGGSVGTASGTSGMSGASSAGASYGGSGYGTSSYGSGSSAGGSTGTPGGYGGAGNSQGAGPGGGGISDYGSGPTGGVSPGSDSWGSDSGDTGGGGWGSDWAGDGAGNGGFASNNTGQQAFNDALGGAASASPPAASTPTPVAERTSAFANPNATGIMGKLGFARADAPAIGATNASFPGATSTPTGFGISGFQSPTGFAVPGGTAPAPSSTPVNGPGFSTTGRGFSSAVASSLAPSGLEGMARGTSPTGGSFAATPSGFTGTSSGPGGTSGGGSTLGGTQQGFGDFSNFGSKTGPTSTTIESSNYAGAETLDQNRGMESQVAKTGGSESGSQAVAGWFASNLAQRESSNRPGIVNSLGYAGLYQFGAPQAKTIGIYTPGKNENLGNWSITSKDAVGKWSGTFNIPGFESVKTIENFLANPAAQKAAFNVHIGHLDKEISNRGLEQHIGKTIGGVELSREGLYAMMHIGGAKGAADFLSGKKGDPADAYGTNMSDYAALGVQPLGYVENPGLPPTRAERAGTAAAPQTAQVNIDAYLDGSLFSGTPMGTGQGMQAWGSQSNVEQAAMNLGFAPPATSGAQTASTGLSNPFGASPAMAAPGPPASTQAYTGTQSANSMGPESYGSRGSASAANTAAPDPSIAPQNLGPGLTIANTPSIMSPQQTPPGQVQQAYQTNGGVATPNAEGGVDINLDAAETGGRSTAQQVAGYAGQGVGSMLGGIVGTGVAGPIGGLAGGLLGGWLGDKMGDGQPNQEAWGVDNNGPSDDGRGDGVSDAITDAPSENVKRLEEKYLGLPMWGAANIGNGRPTPRQRFVENRSNYARSL